jgi:branched-chain amino acid transport system permease protein
VLYLPGGLASLRIGTFGLWGDDLRAWWRALTGTASGRAKPT